MKKLLLIALAVSGLTLIPGQRAHAQVTVGLPGVGGISFGFPGGYYGYPTRYNYYPYGYYRRPYYSYSQPYSYYYSGTRYYGPRKYHRHHRHHYRNRYLAKITNPGINRVTAKANSRSRSERFQSNQRFSIQLPDNSGGPSTKRCSLIFAKAELAIAIINNYRCSWPYSQCKGESAGSGAVLFRHDGRTHREDQSSY